MRKRSRFFETGSGNAEREAGGQFPPLSRFQHIHREANAKGHVGVGACAAGACSAALRLES